VASLTWQIGFHAVVDSTCKMHVRHDNLEGYLPSASPENAGEIAPSFAILEVH
jgi:hypothetical protein